MKETMMVDMSPEAIDRRLRELGQLYRLGMSFRDVRPPRGVEESPKERQASDLVDHH